MKTNKHQTLLLVKKKDSVRALDLYQRFGYSSGTARSYLSYLSRQDLLKRTPQGHVLTEKGRDRLQFFEVMGCANPDCPLCQGKKAGHFTCPTCEYRLPKEKAHLRPVWETPFFRREAGVYCPRCQNRILTEEQLRLMESRKQIPSRENTKQYDLTELLDELFGEVK